MWKTSLSSNTKGERGKQSRTKAVFHLGAPARFPLAVGGITLLAALLRAWGLGRQSLWFDEAFTVWVARQPWGDVLNILVNDGVHPPLFYSLEKLTLALGQSGEIMARLPAMVFGVLSVPLLALLARSWSGERVALWAALLYALAPFHVWYSQEARMYSLLALLTLLSIGAYWAWWRRPRLLTHGAFILTHSLAYLTHYFALWVSVIELLHLTLHRRRGWSRLKTWGFWQLLASLPLMYWLYLLQQRPERFFGIGWIPRPSFGDIPLTLLNLTVGYWQAPPLLAGGLTLLFILAMLLALRARRRDQEALTLIAFWGFIPLLLTLVISLVLPFHVFMDRYLIMAQPPLLLLMAKGLAYRPSPRKRSLAAWPLLLAIPFLLVMTVTDNAILNGQQMFKENWRDVAAYLNRESAADEVVLLRHATMAIPFQIYPLAAPVRIWEWNRERYAFDELVAGYRGVWVVYWNAVGHSHMVIHEWVHSVSFETLWEDDPLTQTWENRPDFTLKERRDFPGLTLFHLRRP